jgi:hypothetical protein
MSLLQIVLIAMGAVTALVVLFCLVAAAASKAGREELAVVGVKIAYGLGDLFLLWVSEQHVEPILGRHIERAQDLQSRRIKRL